MLFFLFFTQRRKVSERSREYQVRTETPTQHLNTSSERLKPKKDVLVERVEVEEVGRTERRSGRVEKRKARKTEHNVFFVFSLVSIESMRRETFCSFSRVIETEPRRTRNGQSDARCSLRGRGDLLKTLQRHSTEPQSRNRRNKNVHQTFEILELSSLFTFILNNHKLNAFLSKFELNCYYIIIIIIINKECLPLLHSRYLQRISFNRRDNSTQLVSLKASLNVV